MTVLLLRLLPRRRRTWVVVLAALLLPALAGGFGYQWYRRAAADRHYRAASEALARGDAAGARAHLALCLEVRGDSAEVHFLAARAARRAGAYDEARDHLAACRRLGGPPEALALEGVLARVQRGDFAGVETSLWERVHRGDPDAPWILEALAQGYVETYHLAGALQCSERLLANRPDHARALVWHGWVMEQLHRFPDARDDYRRAVDLRPEDDWARLCLGEVLLHLNRPAEAVEHFEYLNRRQPDNPAILLGLARCRRAQGRTEEALRLLDRVQASLPDEAPVLSERGQLLFQAGCVEKAEACLRQAVARSPADRLANYALAQCLQRRGQKAAARRYLARVKEIEEDGKSLTRVLQEIVKAKRAPARRCQAGVLCLRLGREAEGVRWLKSALQEDPRLPEAHRALADYYERTGRPDLAGPHRRLAGPGR